MKRVGHMLYSWIPCVLYFLANLHLRYSFNYLHSLLRLLLLHSHSLKPQPHLLCFTVECREPWFRTWWCFFSPGYRDGETVCSIKDFYKIARLPHISFQSIPRITNIHHTDPLSIRHEVCSDMCFHFCSGNSPSNTLSGGTVGAGVRRRRYRDWCFWKNRQLLHCDMGMYHSSSCGFSSLIWSARQPSIRDMRSKRRAYTTRSYQCRISWLHSYWW